jgi:hypothetical protein
LGAGTIPIRSEQELGRMEHNGIENWDKIQRMLGYPEEFAIY